MLPRTRSIFHLEEEEEEEEEGENALIDYNGGILPKKAARKGLVGLQILIQNHEHQANNIVINSSKKICNKSAIIFVDFLKSCFLCTKELSLQKEVYMYRGDQGFCSEECRYKQILQDERRAFDAARRLRFGVPNRHHLGYKIHESNARTKNSVAA